MKYILVLNSTVGTLKMYFSATYGWSTKYENVTKFDDEPIVLKHMLNRLSNRTFSIVIEQID